MHCKKQIKTDISPLTIKNIINHPGRSWVDATAKYIIVSWNRSRPLAFTESHFIYYSWLNSPVGKVKGFSYIMNGYLNGQDMGPSSLWNSVAGPARKRFFGHIIDPLLTKPLYSRWLDIGLILFLFFAFSLTSLILIHKKNTKKNFANIQASWPTCDAWSVSHSNIILSIVECTCYMYEAVCSLYFSTRSF